MVNLVFVRKADNSLAPQKWTHHPRDLTSSYAKEVVAGAIALPPEDENLTIDVLIGKYGYPAVSQ